MLKVFFMFMVFLGGISSGIAQIGFSLSGKLRLLDPTEIKVTSIEGKEILSIPIVSGKEFHTKLINIEPDVYILSVGRTTQPIYLTNNFMMVKIRQIVLCHLMGLMIIWNYLDGSRQRRWQRKKQSTLM